MITIAAGPSTTTKIAGNMNRTSGKTSFTVVFAAFSSASWRDAGPELIDLDDQAGQCVD